MMAELADRLPDETCPICDGDVYRTLDNNLRCLACEEAVDNCTCLDEDDDEWEEEEDEDDITY